MRDIVSNIQLRRAISPQSSANDTAVVSSIIDRQGFDSLGFLIAIGSIGDADATFTVLVEHGSAANLADAAAVPDDQLVTQTVGTAPEAAAGFTFAADDQVRKIGYVGDRRYVRLTITPLNNSGTPSAAFLAAVAILGNPEHAPVIQVAA